MFHLYIALAYIFPAVYLYFRIRKLFIGKQYRWLYTLIYLLTAAIYPMVDRFSDHSMNPFIRMLSTVSGYLLPFFLYLFLFILLLDLFLLVNLRIKIISADTRGSFSFRFYTLCVILFLSMVVVISGIINLNTIRVTKYTIDIPRKRSNIEHLRIAFVADIHLRQNTRLGLIEQLVRKINVLKPDLMLYGGDITEGDSENETTGEIESTLRKIETRYGTYGVLGNHEFYGGQDQGDFFQNAGIIILSDTAIIIDNSFLLAGRNDQHFRQRKDIGAILKGLTSDLPLILLDHRPADLQSVSETSVDIQLSGHTHNGQMFPINLITKSIYELSWGHKKIRDTHFFVTSGLRLWGPPVKTAGKSEIMLIDIILK